MSRDDELIQRGDELVKRELVKRLRTLTAVLTLRVLSL